MSGAASSLANKLLSVISTKGASGQGVLQEAWDNPSLGGSKLEDWRTIQSEHLGGVQHSHEEQETMLRGSLGQFTALEKPLKKKHFDKLISEGATSVCRAASLLETTNSLKSAEDDEPVAAVYNLEASAKWIHLLLRTYTGIGDEDFEKKQVGYSAYIPVFQGMIKASEMHAKSIIESGGWKSKASASA